MNYNDLANQIHKKKSYLCIGLDTDPTRLPTHLDPSPENILKFNKSIIGVTAPHAVAYKINTAFYESLGAVGWEVMKETIACLPNDVLVIADAKRGDIGNTSKQYAQAFFEHLNVDAITLSPYMGKDSIMPYLEFKDKWIILLALTSNPGSQDFQQLKLNGASLYEQVVIKSREWGSRENTMYVIGGTHPKELSAIRQLAPEHFFLVPGIGSQGGDLRAVSLAGLHTKGGLLVNSSRAIIYASPDENYLEAAAAQAANYHQEMAALLTERVPFAG